jgi:hypothetical protein
VESGVEMKITIEFTLGLGRVITIELTLGLGRVTPILGSITRHPSVVLVALIVAACVAPVLVVVSHANPAEFKFALLAGHVVAALVLFNPNVAFWTRLGVGKDPIGRT